MKLTVYLPSEIFLDTMIKKIVGESPCGSFGLLPRHIDLVTALVPGILRFLPASGTEEFIAVKGGILVKQQDQVFIATQMAVRGELGLLKETVDQFVHEVDEREKQIRTAVTRLEAGFIRRFVEFGKNA